MIDVKNISVRKGVNTIVKNASFNILPGKIGVVIGKNGAGKSTLFEALTGNNEIEKGEIVWDKQLISTLDMRSLATRRAVLSQNVSVSFPIRVAELVEMGTYASTAALPKIKVKNLVRHALTEMEMLEFKDRIFTSLSGGEQKRVLLAKCIVQLNCCHWANVNKYLFLDEPTANLDIQQQYKLIDKIKKLAKRRNIGVFAVLHDLNLAAQFADEIIIMKSGRVRLKGNPMDVLTPTVLTQNFGINTIVKPHPVLKDCPLITTLPYQTNNCVEKSLVNF